MNFQLNCKELLFHLALLSHPHSLLHWKPSSSATDGHELKQTAGLKRQKSMPNCSTPTELKRRLEPRKSQSAIFSAICIHYVSTFYYNVSANCLGKRKT
ncbi:unnamed protein product [Citrullus colocynthis]|uniref:Secreted protein n=1 Tax=Citrullus colocynthis TaxID=252529 RepID=A0ABP0Y3Y3_9ROSI